MNYGGEWSEPPESYIVLVCFITNPPCTTAPHMINHPCLTDIHGAAGACALLQEG